MLLIPNKVLLYRNRASPPLFIFLFLLRLSSTSSSMSAMSPTTVTTTTTTTIETAAKIAKGDCNLDCKTTTTMPETAAIATTTTTTPTGVAARLARANILELSPYRCARDDYSEGILLDANENAYGPAMATKKKHDNDEEELELHRYPDPYQIPLKLRLAKLRSGNNSFLTPAHFFIGVGSDEAIDLLMRIFCRPGHDAILTTPPTYGMYKVCAKVNDVDVVTVPLTPDFDVVIPNILNAMTPNVKLIFLCSPGNPTAKAIPLPDIERIVSSAEAQNAIVVVDEAYIDFACPVADYSAVKLIAKYPNVVVLQTLSKAFGLAAIRCGFCLGPPDIIQLLNNVKAPYNINALTSRLAISALDEILDQKHSENILSKNIASILQQRDVVMQALKKLDFVQKVYPSDANFVLFSIAQNAQAVYKNMADDGVVIRYRGNEMHCAECLRVTIGTPEENQAFLQKLVDTYQSLS